MCFLEVFGNIILYEESVSVQKCGVELPFVHVGDKSKTQSTLYSTYKTYYQQPPQVGGGVTVWSILTPKHIF